MLCQKCGLRDATVRMMRIVNGERETLFLCDQCAREEGSFSGGLYDFITTREPSATSSAPSSNWATSAAPAKATTS